MKPAEFLQRSLRYIELRANPAVFWRHFIWTLRGARIGRGTRLPKRCLATWPHQVQLGEDCILQPEIFFNYDHYWTSGPSIIVGDRTFIGRAVEFNIRGRFEIGEDCLIASHCTFVDHDHGLDPSVPSNQQSNIVAPITLGRNVWLGAGVTVLKGVHIGDNAVAGAGSVVTKSIPAGEIWAGIPARCLRAR